MKTFFKSLLYSSPVALIFSWMFIYSDAGNEFAWQLRNLPAYTEKGMYDLMIISFWEWFCISLIFATIPVYLALKSNTKCKNLVIFFDMLGIMFFGATLLADIRSELLLLGIVIYVIALVWGIVEVIQFFSESVIDNCTMTTIKSEIVNNEKFLNLEKTERIEYLRNLKKKTIVELEKYNRDIQKEKNRLDNIPDGVAKYIKHKKTPNHKKVVDKLEHRIVAIDELIRSETEK